MTIQAPLLRTPDTTARIMWNVSFALAPALGVTAYFQGAASLAPVAMCAASAMIIELAVSLLARRPVTLGDGSALLSGLLLGATLPPSAPWYVCLVASAVAILLGKHVLGGLGRNTFNPALLGRAVVFIAFPLKFAGYAAPSGAIDALSSATPLAALKGGMLEEVLASTGSRLELYLQLLLGNHGGSIGETSALALLVAAVYLLWRGYITWHIPMGFMAAVGITGWLIGGSDGFATGDGLVHVLGGGTVLGACFMATDYVTSPMLPRARISFGVLCGVLAVIIRVFTPMPEGVMYAILLMNPFSKVLENVDHRLKNGLPLFARRVGKRPSSFWLARAYVWLITLGLIGNLVAPAVACEIKTRREKAIRQAEMLSTVSDHFVDGAEITRAGSWRHHDEDLLYFRATEDGETTGYAVESCAEGYGGLIHVLVILRGDLSIREVSVLSHNETPNLGSRIEEEEFLEQFVDRPAAKLVVTTEGEEGLVQAITAATISSRAVTEDAVRTALKLMESKR